MRFGSLREHGPLGGVERPRRVVRFTRFDSTARPRLLSRPSAAIRCHELSPTVVMLEHGT